MLEGGVALHPEGYGDREVLRLGLVRLDRGRVVVEGLPLVGVAVPVQTRCLRGERRRLKTVSHQSFSNQNH